MNPREFGILEQGSYRASEGDRENTITQLRDALATGRLDQDVFDRRLDAAMRCYNLQDLRMLTRDLWDLRPLAPSPPKRYTMASAVVTAFQSFLAGVLIMVMCFAFLFTAHAPAGAILNRTGSLMFVPSLIAFAANVLAFVWRTPPRRH